MNENQLKKKLISVKRIILKKLRELQKIKGFDELDELTKTKGELRKVGQKLSEMINLLDNKKDLL